MSTNLFNLIGCKGMIAINKTLKTVLITVGVMLFAIVVLALLMDDSDNSTSDAPATGIIEEPQDTPKEVTLEEFQKILSYDIFDWGMEDDQGKLRIAEEIISIWAEDHINYNYTYDELVDAINQELAVENEQANIFEKACIAAKIDPVPYFALINNSAVTEAPAEEPQQTTQPATQKVNQGMSKDEFTKIMFYDIFDWNMADEQGQVRIAQEIINVWSESGVSCNFAASDLAIAISNNLEDQANIFDTACYVAGIDSAPYFALLN